MAPLVNGTSEGPNGTSSASSATVPFTPITPGARDGVHGLRGVLEQTPEHVRRINSASALEGEMPTMDNLRGEITRLKAELDEFRSEDLEATMIEITANVKREVKTDKNDHIKKKIDEEVDHFIRKEVKNLIESKDLVGTLQKLSAENKELLKATQIQLDNSEARRLNSTFDVQGNFKERLHVVHNSQGVKPDGYPSTLQALFGYSENDLVKLLKDYGLETCRSKIDNLNRFLAFIGVRISLPEQEDLWVKKKLAAPGQTNGAAAEKEVRGQLESIKHNERKSPAENPTSREKQQINLNRQHKMHPPLKQKAPQTGPAIIPVSTRKSVGDVEKNSGETRTVAWYRIASSGT